MNDVDYMSQCGTGTMHNWLGFPLSLFRMCLYLEKGAVPEHIHVTRSKPRIKLYTDFNQNGISKPEIGSVHYFD